MLLHLDCSLGHPDPNNRDREIVLSCLQKDGFTMEDLKEGIFICDYNSKETENYPK